MLCVLSTGHVTFLNQGLANYNQRAKCSLIPVFVNNVSLEHSQLMHLCTVYGGFHAETTWLSSHKIHNIFYLGLKKKVLEDLGFTSLSLPFK